MKNHLTADEVGQSVRKHFLAGANRLHLMTRAGSHPLRVSEVWAEAGNVYLGVSADVPQCEEFSTETAAPFGDFSAMETMRATLRRERAQNKVEAAMESPLCVIGQYLGGREIRA
jgi:hypothetical protein